MKAIAVITLLCVLLLCCSISLVTSTATLRARLQAKELEASNLGAGSSLEVIAAPAMDLANSYAYNVHFKVKERKMTTEEKNKLKKELQEKDKDKKDGKMTEEEIEKELQKMKTITPQELSCCKAGQVDGAMDTARTELDIGACPKKIGKAGPNVNFVAGKTFVYPKAVTEITDQLKSSEFKVPLPAERGALPFYQPTNIGHLYKISTLRPCDSKYVQIGQHIIYQVGQDEGSFKTCYFFYHGTLYPDAAESKPAFDNFKVDYPTLGANLGGGFAYTREYINGVLDGTKAATPQDAVLIAAVFIAEVYRNTDTYFFNLIAMDLKGTVADYLHGKCPGNSNLWTSKVQSGKRCSSGTYGGLHNMAWGKSTEFVDKRKRWADYDPIAGPPIVLTIQRWHQAKWLEGIAEVKGTATVGEEDVDAVVQIEVDNTDCSKECDGGERDKKAKVNGKAAIQFLFEKLHAGPVSKGVNLGLEFDLS